MLCAACGLAVVLSQGGASVPELARAGLLHVASSAATTPDDKSCADSRDSHARHARAVLDLVASALTVYADTIFELAAPAAPPAATPATQQSTQPPGAPPPAPSGAPVASEAQHARMTQLLEGVSLLQCSGQLDGSAPFRLPRCCLGGSSCGDAAHGRSAIGGDASTVSRQLRSRQWEGGWHAVLDTAQRSAARAGWSTPLLETMCTQQPRVEHHACERQ